MQMFEMCFVFRRTYRTSETEKAPGDVHLWRINCLFQVQILWATYINATDNVIFKYKIKFFVSIAIKVGFNNFFFQNCRSALKLVYFMVMRLFVNFYRLHRFPVILLGGMKLYDFKYLFLTYREVRVCVYQFVAFLE